MAVGRREVGDGVGIEEQNRTWGDGPEWLVDRDRPDVHHFPDCGGGDE